MEIIGYIFILGIVATASYFACRTYDHFLYKEEEKIEAEHNERLIRAAGNEAKWLSDDFIRKMNDSIQETYTRMMNTEAN